MFDKLRIFFKMATLINEIKQQRSPEINDNPNTIDSSLHHNLSILQHYFEKSDDVIFRQFRLGDDDKTNVFICWVDGLVNEGYVNSNIKALIIDFNSRDRDREKFYNAGTANLLTKIKEQIINASSLNL